MKPRVAVIEDDLPIAQMYEFKLLQSGYDVKVAHDGRAGLKLAEDFRPHLLLLDLRMPVMTGDQMLAKLRQTDWGKDIRVIVLTNISRSEAPQQLQFLGIDRYVVKAHTTPAQVQETVRELLA